MSRCAYVWLVTGERPLLGYFPSADRTFAPKDGAVADGYARDLTLAGYGKVTLRTVWNEKPVPIGWRPIVKGELVTTGDKYQMPGYNWRRVRRGTEYVWDPKTCWPCIREIAKIPFSSSSPTDYFVSDRQA